MSSESLSQSATTDEEFVDEVEQAIKDYLGAPNRYTRRLKTRYLDLDEPNRRIAAAFVTLRDRGDIEQLGQSGLSTTYRWLGDIPEPEPEPEEVER